MWHPGQTESISIGNCNSVATQAEIKTMEEEFPEVSFWQSPGFWCHYWFNPAPSEDCRPYQTKWGRTYWLQIRGDNEFITICRLFYRGNIVGYANLAGDQEQGYLTLCDIRVSEQHSRQGLGTALLHEVFLLAMRRSFPQIQGKIVAKDAAAFPGLLDWYRKHGFVVQSIASDPQPDGTNRNETNEVAAIIKVLGNEAPSEAVTVF